MHDSVKCEVCLATLDPGLASYVLESVGNEDFENFGQAILFHTLGVEFEATGGMHDGGQDGYLRQRMGQPDHYIQISTRADYSSKLRQTISRLLDSGRSPRNLTYLTTRQIPNKDIIESKIEKETGVSIRILDKRWITLQIQTDDAAGIIFADSFARGLQTASILNEHVSEIYSPSDRMSIMSYMEVHAASEPNEMNLLPLAIDSAIYLALDGTDPDRGIFRSAEEIVAFVEEKFPAVKGRKDIHLPDRITRLSSKQGMPRIRHHRKNDGYCLPYDVRSEFSEHGKLVRNAEIAFWDSIRTRLATEDLPSDVLDAAIAACHYGIEKTFERQGLNFLASIRGAKFSDEVRTHEFISEKLAEISDRNDIIDITKACQNVVRHAFYSPNEIEADHIFRLFKAFSIEFAIKGDSAVASYFGKLVKKLKLYVGTDVIVRALSEECAKPVGRATQNALRMLSRAGAKLYLTEFVLEEVWHHIHSTDIEFRNFYASWERQATLPEVQNSDKILIRAYFYGRLEPQYHERSPSNWDQFLSYFGDASWFRDKVGIEGFGAFLRKKFGFKFVSKDEMRSALVDENVAGLERELEDQKKDARLAWNDAYQSLYVRRQRRIDGDVGGESIYGFANWWLTEEFKVLEALKKVGVKRQLTMHPQFLMNLFAASPSLSQMTSDFKGLFPTHFGLRITSRVDSGTMHKFLEKVKTAAESSEARADAYIRVQANRYLNTNYAL